MLVDRFGLGRRVGYGGEAYSAVLGEAADHVEHDAYLSGSRPSAVKNSPLDAS